MAQFKIYGRAEFLRAEHRRISDALHGASVRSLALPAEKRFHRFLPLDSWQLVAPSDRSARYLIIEVVLFTGRSTETRKALIRAIMDDLARALAMAEDDIEVTLFESPRENWGIRGQHGDEMKLSYQVQL